MTLERDQLHGSSFGFGAKMFSAGRPQSLLRMLVFGVLFFQLIAAHAQVTGRIEKPIASVSNPPPVQMLVPGFTVREVPLELNNINNLVFAPDGRLFALCYDGNVLQLKDTNGDGLPDMAAHFYRNDKNEIPASIGMCWGPGGLYIASQGRVIRLRDKGDGTAELETVTSGWVKPTGAAGSNLDSIGIAVNKAGEIFFGLGADKWNEAYRVNKQTGKSDYNLHSERGTVLKILPNGKREVICTGMRFPVGMAFNAAGDLFTTDQEGATWLPNGNPFDELLHIQPGRHYGFPPRHPKYLPDVIDEPSTFDYAPQHESTCGLHFNEPVGGGKRIFGPDWWRGDAFVSGESRGKIWRTKLVKTAAGYIAKTDLIACLSMLTIDAVPTPQGDLLVACHSGKPDWGTGPQGKGKLFQISYANKFAPQPVFAYAASPTKTRVIFDRGLAAVLPKNVVAQSTVAIGKYVTAGERFESFRPGYQVVKIQRTMPRFEIPVKSVTTRVEFDKASVDIEAAAHSEAVNCAVTLPGAVARNLENIDVLADLTGVDAVWRAFSGSMRDLAGIPLWLPHLDLAAARGLAAASREHEEFFKRLQRHGTLTLRAQLDLTSMLHPAVQPESKLDYEYPPETVTVVFKGSGKIDVTASASVSHLNEREVRLTVRPGAQSWLPVEVTLVTTATDPILDVSWFTDEDHRPRPLPLRRVLLPWAKPYLPTVIANPTPEIVGGNWERGRKIFFGEQAACFKCHQVGGEGGEIGPNLSNLIYRDYASVLKDITEPSASINPEHIGYTVQLKEGETESGVMLKNDRSQVVLGRSDGKSLTIPKAKITDMKASAISIMPEGLLKPFDAQQQKDLMTFLLTVPVKETK
jgi:putative heme-binding domain-containing protein